MTKLRPVEERGPTQEHEQDLRGLGDEAILSRMVPEYILSIYGEDESLKRVAKLVQSLPFQTEALIGQNSVHYRSKGLAENIKENGIELFGVLTAIHQLLNEEDLSIQMWLLSKSEIMLGDSGTEVDIEAIHTACPDQNWDNYVQVCYPCTLHLHQAGILENKHSNDLSISRRDMDAISSSFIEIDEVTTQKRKLA